MSVKWSKVVLFGDSQVQRSFEPNDGLWGALLADRLQRNCDVITRGFSGYTSRSCLKVLQYIFSRQDLLDVSAFVICLGTNDCSGKDEGIPEHVPIKEYSQNMEEIIGYLQEMGLNKDKLILMTPGPYHHRKFLDWCNETGRTFPKRSNETVLKYVETCINIAKKLDIDVINVYQEMMYQEDWPRFLKDGLHFTKAGSHLIYNALWPFIVKRIDANKLILPYWRDINHLPKDVKEENISELILNDS